MSAFLKLISISLAILLLIPSPIMAALQADIDAVFKNSIDYDPRTFGTENCSFTLGAVPEATLSGFIDAYGEAALTVGKDYGIPYEAILVQGMLESNYGKSTLTTIHFNFFGIKAGPSWTGEKVLKDTQEEENGKLITIKDYFRSYPSPEAGFDGYGQFITNNSRYSNALNYPGDPYQYVVEIKAAGYATDSKYVPKLHGLLDKTIAYIEESTDLPPSSEITPNQTPSGLSSSITNCGPTEVGEVAAEVIRLAKVELEKGIVETSRNCGPGIGKYWTGSDDEDDTSFCNDGTGQWAWCAEFISWIYLKAGSPLDYGGGFPEEWSYASVVNLQAAMINADEYFEVGEGEPQPGDIAFYIGSQTPDGGSESHVNIVVSVDGQTMTTIGGNEGNTIKEGTRRIELGASGLVGFGRPSSE